MSLLAIVSVIVSLYLAALLRGGKQGRQECDPTVHASDWRRCGWLRRPGGKGKVPHRELRAFCFLSCRRGLFFFLDVCTRTW